jgi:capsular exopolysaccharide synthesis family protein
MVFLVLACISLIIFELSVFIILAFKTRPERWTFKSFCLWLVSLLGKKVVIVGLDIRKPGLNKVFNISRKEHGITQFLTNPTKNLMDLVQPSDINKNLFILPGGSVPPNPTELLARDGLEKAIETLKANFDYVILDTAPVGMVTDTLLIGRTADLSVYVCRADYTRKTEFTLINELSENNK